MDIIYKRMLGDSEEIRDFVEKEEFSIALIETSARTTYLDNVPILILVLAYDDAQSVQEKLSTVFQKTKEEHPEVVGLFLEASMPPSVSPSPLVDFNTHKSVYIVPSVAETLVKYLKEHCGEFRLM